MPPFPRSAVSGTPDVPRKSDFPEDFQEGPGGGSFPTWKGGKLPCPEKHTELGTSLLGCEKSPGGERPWGLVTDQPERAPSVGEQTLVHERGRKKGNICFLGTFLFVTCYYLCVFRNELS